MRVDITWPLSGLQVLVLTVLSERSDDSLCTVRVEFEDGSEPFSHSLGSHDTVEALLSELYRFAPSWSAL